MMEMGELPELDRYNASNEHNVSEPCGRGNTSESPRPPFVASKSVICFSMSWPIGLKSDQLPARRHYKPVLTFLAQGRQNFQWCVAREQPAAHQRIAKTTFGHNVLSNELELWKLLRCNDDLVRWRSYGCPNGRGPRDHQQNAFYTRSFRNIRSAKQVRHVH